ncbi:MAG: hypothetical protein P8R04_05510 [Gammaproteobacteria bacterium]|nr:hypothetical protein [Gammaproteobacteria bacterium]
MSSDNQTTDAGMASLLKAASIAAFLIFIAMLLHNFNANYYEPVHLGFVDKATDYGDMAKIENAIWSWSFTSSGIAHAIVGFCMIIIGVAVSRLAMMTCPVASQLMVIAAVVSGIGFLLTGVSDIPGTKYGELLRQLNPDYNTNILLMTTMFRGVVNTLAIIGLSTFSGILAWYTLHSGKFPRWFGWLGYVLVLPGLLAMLNPVFGFGYLVLAPVWACALGIYFRRMHS